MSEKRGVNAPPLIVSQFLWAATQAMIVLLLGHVGGLDMVGFVTLGLAINAPLFLLLSLNLRVRIAINVELCNYHSALVLRVLASLLAWFVTVGVLYAHGGYWQDFAIASLVVGMRIADQIADLSIGYYQNRNQINRISRSMLLRALTFGLPYLLAFYIGASMMFASITAFIVSIAAVILFDRPFTFSTTGLFVGFRDDLKKLLMDTADGFGKSMFPFLDSLHFNLVRYAAYVFLPISVLGQIGLAQIMYSPIALVITAVGYSNLSMVRKHVSNLDMHALSRVINKNSALVGILVCGLFVAIGLSPEWILDLIGLTSSEGGRVLALWVVATLLPHSMTGFHCQGLIGVSSDRAYGYNPIIGIVLFLLLISVMALITGEVSAITVFTCFALSSIGRLIAARLKIATYIRGVLRVS